MAHTSTYLNFSRNTQQAFDFYKSVFGGEFEWGIHRFADIPQQEWMPEIAETDKQLIMHVALRITGNHLLQGTDAPESMGFALDVWNNVYISLHPDTRDEADRLFWELSKDGKVEMPMTDMFWGAYYGSFKDQFGIGWMINCEEK